MMVIFAAVQRHFKVNVNINLFSKNIKTNAKVKSWSDIL
jgi:hypothetical protein